jgi:flagellar biosynthesis protein FlhA
VGTIRRQIASELGMVIPAVRIRDDVNLDSHEYVMRVRGTEVARGGVMAGHHMAMNPGDAMGQLPGIPTTEPAFGLPAVWIPDSGRAEAEALGWTVVDAESVVVTHLTETIRKHAGELLTRQETRHLLDQLKEVNAAVVDEVVPDVLSLGEVQRVLQALLREGVSIRDLGSVLEAIGDKARLTRDPAMLAEYARQALGRTIVAPFLDAESSLRVIALDPQTEQGMAEALVQTADGEFLAMDPAQAAQIVDSAASQVEMAMAMGHRPVLLCSARVRRHLRSLCEQRLPQLAVCSYNEIPAGIGVETTGVIGGAVAAAA